MNVGKNSLIRLSWWWTLVSSGCCLTYTEIAPPPEIEPPEKIIFYSYEVVNEYPHDTEAFTQGLIYHKGFLYEGTGLYGASSIRKINLETGEILLRSVLPSAYFGEGITIYEDRLIQLTWKSQVGFTYRIDNFEKLGEFSYLGEGWGITHDGKRLIMSDGTSRLRFLHPQTFEELGSLYVRYGTQLIKKLNELENVEGCIFANIWQEDKIAIINLNSGYVTGWIDLTNLLQPEDAQKADVLNGIAWDAVKRRLLVTGKKWPKIFEIRLVERGSAPYPATVSK